MRLHYNLLGKRAPRVQTQANAVWLLRPGGMSLQEKEAEFLTL